MKCSGLLTGLLSNLLTLSRLFQWEDMLPGYVQTVAFNLASPGPGEEVPQQGGL